MEILSVIVGEVLKKVASLSSKEIGAAWGLKLDLKMLQNRFSMIQAVLIDAEKRQVQEELVKLWLRRLKQVAYDADDVLDDFSSEILLRKMELHNRFKSKVCNFFSVSNPIAFRFKMAHKIRDINQSLIEIEKDKVMFKFTEITVPPLAPYSMGDRKTSSHVNASQIVGRETEKMKIVNLLINSGDQDDVLPVVSIVGIGGLGKTTLAQIVYNEESVQQFFDTRVWVCVSEVFDVDRILREIIESVTRMKCDFSNMDVVVSTLQEELRGKSFLLVLDDVWNEETDKWERFKSLLGDSVRGSKIIVTTRSGKVASIVGTLPTLHLQVLSEENCWLLFNHCAFKTGGAVETSKFLEIGRDIVRKCGGVPLALIHVASMMHSNNDEREWLRLRDSKIWLLPENKKIIEVLKMSYDNLSSSLKQCFSYCAMFTKDQVIDKKVLVQLWMAEGFLDLQAERSNQLMEDIGGENIIVLMQRSFFQPVKMDEFECKFKMHDLIHDLSRSVVGNEWCIENVEIEEYASEIRRLSCVSNCTESWVSTNKLRTFIWQGTLRRDSIKVFSSRFLKMNYLRVLDLHGTGIKELPSSVSKLRHLRYLGLSGTPVEALPDAICRLHNLQTLRLLNCEKLKALPEGLKKLVSLRHLEIEPYLSTPRNVGQLSCLRTLPYFRVGKEGSGWGITELQCLNLGGELNIGSLENVANATEAKGTNLENKSNIHTLRLAWFRIDILQITNTADDVLEGLKPHSELRRLHIYHFVGVKIPKWMNVAFLPNLVEIFLWNWKRCEHLPPLGQLPCLRVLKIREMNALRCIGNELYGYDNNGDGTQAMVVVFRSLQYLQLYDMRNLEEWVEPNSCSLFPLLEKLSIGQCPKLTKTPSFPSLKELIVSSSNKILLESVSSKLSSLTKLDIHNFTEMTSLPQGLLQRNNLLQTLLISKCNELGELPMEELPHLKSLHQLCLQDCTSLTRMPDLRCLTSLKTLEIVGTIKAMNFLPECLHCLPFLEYLAIGRFIDEVDVFPLEGIQHMVSLRHLGLVGWPNIKSLPEQLRHLTSLPRLGIKEFEGLESMPDWITDLSSLQALWINKCRNLKHLPQGMQLRSLRIVECPLLEERCQMETGEEWHKIAHIPYVLYK